MGYLRRWLQNFTVTDNRATTPADYTQFSIVAPLDPRLPGGGGYSVSGLYDVAPDKFSAVDNYRTYAPNYGVISQMYNGFEFGLQARIKNGTQFQFGDADYVSWLNLGDAYSWLQGRKDDAAGAYAQAIRLGRDQMLALAKRGQSVDAMIPADLATVFARLQQPDSARMYIGRAVSADSTNPRVQYCAALTCWQLGVRRRALAWLERAVQNGYPRAWLRDSPVFAEWRGEESFRALIAGSGPAHR